MLCHVMLPFLFLHFLFLFSFPLHYSCFVVGVVVVIVVVVGVVVVVVHIRASMHTWQASSLRGDHRGVLRLDLLTIIIARGLVITVVVVGVAAVLAAASRTSASLAVAWAPGGNVRG